MITVNIYQPITLT